MNRKLIVGFVLILMFALASVCGAVTGPWIQWDNGAIQTLTKVEIPLAERVAGLEHYVYQLGSDWNSGFLFSLNASSPFEITAIGGGDSFVDADGLPIYVRLAAAVTNTGSEAWSEFHIHTGDGGSPYKAYGGWWPSDWNISSNADGWDFTKNPNGVTVVQPGQVLKNEVWIRIDPSTNSFAVNTSSVPEPSGFLAVFTGLAGVIGLGLRSRRIR